MEQGLGHYLMAPIHKWLTRNKGGLARLLAAGVPERSLMMKTTGDKFLFANKSHIEGITGLNIGNIMISAMKRSLWGRKNDRLSDINSREDLMRELHVIAETRWSEVNKQLHFSGNRKRFEQFLLAPDRLGLNRMKDALLLIAQSRSPLPASSAEKKPAPKKDNSSQRTAESIISMLTSLTNMADANIDSDSVSESAKINIASAIAKLLEKLGITSDTLKAFKQKRGGTDTTNLQHVFEALGGKV